MTSKKQPPKSLIIWDKDSKYDIPESEVIKSEEEFEKIQKFDFDVIFILAELSWRSRTEFYGFTVAKILRLENKLTCPIVFCSFLSETQLYNFPESKILRRPGHYFVRLPDEKPQFENYIGIDEDMVEDINGNLFDNHQSIRDIVHNIPSILIKTVKTGGDRVFENVLSVLEIQLTPIKEILLRIKPDIDFLKIENSIKKEVKEIIDKKDFKAENLYDFIDSSVFTKLIPKDENEDNPVWIKRRWQVLFIDDELETRNTVVELFRIKEIFCHPADSAQDAFEILKKDSQNANLISVIISDYRLYLNGDSNFDLWQDLQGPQILKQIHYNPDFKKHYAYVILTQKSSKIRNQISKSHKFYILYFNKKDVLADVNHGFNIFCQRIIEIGSEAFLRKFDTPDSAVWTHGSDRVKPGLSFYYRLHVESFDYEQAEKDIITVSLAEIENIKKNISLNANYEYQCSLILESSYRNENELLKKFRKNILIPRRINWYY